MRSVLLQILLDCWICWIQLNKCIQAFPSASGLDNNKYIKEHSLRLWLLTPDWLTICQCRAYGFVCLCTRGTNAILFICRFEITKTKKESSWLDFSLKKHVSVKDSHHIRAEWGGCGGRGSLWALLEKCRITFLGRMGTLGPCLSTEQMAEWEQVLEWC